MNVCRELTKRFRREEPTEFGLLGMRQDDLLNGDAGHGFKSTCHDDGPSSRGVYVHCTASDPSQASSQGQNPDFDPRSGKTNRSKTEKMSKFWTARTKNSRVSWEKPR
ncbi:MAG: hypothetical protein ACK56I_07485, partial [bacterium]